MRHCWGPKDLHPFALSVVDAADPDGPEPIDDALQQYRRHVELTQRRDGMWWLQGKLTSTVGTQLRAILDSLTKPRSTEVDLEGVTQKIADERPYGQRMHDALDEVCRKMLKSADQPTVGGVPASVVVTIGVDDLLAKAGLAESSDGSMLTSDQLLRIADEAELWPTIIDQDGVPLALGRTQRLASRGQTMALIARDGGLFVSRLYSSGELVRPAPHPGLDSRRIYRPEQLEVALQISPHPFPAERLVLPDQR